MRQSLHPGAAYLKLGDIKGESTGDASGEFWFEDLDPGYASTPKCFSKRNVRDPDALCGDELWSFTRKADKKSPQLLRQAHSGEVFESPCQVCFTEVPFNLSTNPDPTRLCYLLVTLDQCYVKQYKVTGIDEDGDPQEGVSLWFERIHFSFKEGGQTFEQGWDNVKNEPWDGTSNGGTRATSKHKQFIGP